MSDEVKKAAERLRQGFVYGSCPDGWGECCDARLLAEQYLAEHAADDDEPIDEAWLLSVGFKRQGKNWLTAAGDNFRVSYRADFGSVMVNGHFWKFNHSTTRGQLRQLCRALNIALTPIGQEAGK